MTRTGPTKTVPPDHAAGRLAKAAAFHAMARLALQNTAELREPDVAMANAVLAAIAYADALTASCLGAVNQQDHAAAVRLLRAALGNQLPELQEKRFGRLLGRKDEVSYGARPGRRADVENVLRELDAFGAWAIHVLAEKSVRLPFAKVDNSPGP